MNKEDVLKQLCGLLVKGKHKGDFEGLFTYTDEYKTLDVQQGDTGYSVDNFSDLEVIDVNRIDKDDYMNWSQYSIKSVKLWGKQAVADMREQWDIDTLKEKYNFYKQNEKEILEILNKE